MFRIQTFPSPPRYAIDREDTAEDEYVIVRPKAKDTSDIESIASFVSESTKRKQMLLGINEATLNLDYYRSRDKHSNGKNLNTIGDNLWFYHILNY